MDDYTQVAMPIFALALNAVVQCLVIRMYRGGSFLLSVMVGFLAGFVALLALDSLALSHRADPWHEFAATLAVNLVTYSALSYCFFAFMNLVKTSIRIRIFRELRKARAGLSHEQLLALYDDRTIVELRIDRLLRKRQMVQRNDRYFINSFLLTFIAIVIHSAKMLVLGKASQLGNRAVPAQSASLLEGPLTFGTSASPPGRKKAPLLHRVKWHLMRLMERNPYWSYTGKSLVRVLKIGLPHERGYYGIKHLATEADGLFLDVGANDGISVLSFRKINQNYAVISIEANPLHARFLDRLKKSVKRFDYVIVAAGNEQSEMTLYTPFYKGIALHTMASLNLPQLQESTSHCYPESISKAIEYVPQQVKIRKLDEFGFAPNIIKIDVEGFEFDVLLGLQKTIINYRPHIMIENNISTFPKIKQWLFGIGYRFCQYDDNVDRFLPFEGEYSSNMLCDHRILFCIPQEQIGKIPLVFQSSDSSA